MQSLKVSDPQSSKCVFNTKIFILFALIFTPGQLAWEAEAKYRLPYTNSHQTRWYIAPNLPGFCADSPAFTPTGQEDDVM